jgi:hypothetical protein
MCAGLPSEDSDEYIFYHSNLNFDICLPPEQN